MLDLERQYRPLMQELLDAVGRVLESQQFILGEPVAEFERAAQQHLGVAHVLGCSSGTDALWLALAAAGIGPGSAVVTTPFSFFASVSAILPVHLYGQPADWTSIARIGKEHGLKLIEDAAQAWGAEWQGIKAGALGDAAAFSFYPTKNLSAAGDAGMVATQSDELAERVKMLRQHGMRQRYLHDEVGWNARLDGIQAAILNVKLKYIAGWNDARRVTAERYHALFAAAELGEPGPYPAHGIVLPHEVPGSRHVWHQYVIRTARRDSLREFLNARKIGSEIYYPVPLHLQPALKGLGYSEGSFPEAERAAREVLALPIFPELREEEQKTVVNAIAAFLH